MMLQSFRRFTVPASALLSTIIFGGCAAGSGPLLAPQQLTVFPDPPDTARIQLLVRFTTSEDVTGVRGTTLLERIAGAEPEVVENSLYKPYGIALHQGTFYVCDSRRPAIQVVNLQEPRFEQLSLRGSARIVVPINCFVDDEGLLYIADSGREDVLVVDTAGVYQGTLGAGVVGQPGDVVVLGDRVWVSSASTRRVHVFDRESRRELYSLPDTSVGPAEAAKFPANIAVTEEAVYVSDLLGGNVRVFSHEGQLLRTIGSYGNGIGQFVRPKGIAVDREGVVYVVDAAFENVQIFDPEGQLLLFFGGPYRQQGDMNLPAKVVIDYDNVDLFREYVDPRFDLKYLIIVTNQFAPDKVAVYGRVEELPAGGTGR